MLSPIKSIDNHEEIAFGIHRDILTEQNITSYGEDKIIRIWTDSSAAGPEVFTHLLLEFEISERLSGIFRKFPFGIPFRKFFRISEKLTPSKNEL